MDCVKSSRSIEDQSVSSPKQVKENEFVVESSLQKRFYECIFCKRGFTNAQALGGHMNIHRKDRRRIGSTSKQGHTSSSVVKARGSLASGAVSKPYSSTMEMDNYPNKYEESCFNAQSLNSWRRRNYEVAGANLSLRIGSDHEEDVDVCEVNKGDESEDEGIDLELRLGHCGR